MPFGASLRDQFLLNRDLVFLNHGSFGACPVPVLAAQQVWRERFESSPIEFVLGELGGLLRETAIRLGDSVGARGEDLVFVENATTGVNTALRAADLEPGDEVVLLDHAYPAVKNAAAHLCEEIGARLVMATLPFPCQPESVLEALDGALSERTRLVVLDHITSGSGLVLPLESLVARCRELDIPVCVDGAHAPGMLPLDLTSLGVDWYTGNCHKWMWAPKGCAFLWTHPQRQAQTRPLVISLGYGQGYTTEFDWVGTRDVSAWLSLSAALDFMESLGPAEVRSHNHDLVMWGAQHLAELWGVELPVPGSMIGSLVALPMPDSWQGEPTVEAGLAVRGRLYQDRRIEVPVHPIGTRMWVRISAQVYNTREDYEALGEALGSGPNSMAPPGRK
jgi:isopenicillin-N epimerase